VQFSLLDRRPLQQMAPYFAESGMKILAYGALAGGFLTDRYLGKPQPTARPETASLGKYLRTVQQAGGWEHLQRLLRALDGVAKRHDARNRQSASPAISIANVAVAWVLAQPAVAAVRRANPPSSLAHPLVQTPHRTGCY
jgi:aryl-alcohol dehydrogenase-like predicted oxidoreductase